MEYVEGFLSETQSQAMEAHLQECPYCRAEAEHLAETRDRLFRDGEVDPPVSLTAAVMGRILRSETFTPRQPMWRTIMAHKYVTIGVAAAACVAVAFIITHRPTDSVNDLSQQPTGSPVVSTAPLESGTSLALRTGRHATLERLTLALLEEQVPMAEVIVVGTPLDSAPVQPKQPRDLPEVAIRFRVTRILKGDLSDEVITIQRPTPPVGVGVDELAGTEWMLFLSPQYLAGQHPYAGSYNIKLEPEVQAILSGGGVAP